MYCKVCLKNRYSINEEGVCDTCVINLKRLTKSLRVEYVTKLKAILFQSNGKILPKTEWPRMRDAIEAYYANASIEDIDAYNATLRSTKEGNIITRRGYVYLLASSTGHYKIGRAKNVDKRIGQHLRNYPIAITHMHDVACQNMYASERYLLDLFSAKKAQGEWFALDDNDVAWFRSLDETKLLDLVAEWLRDKARS